MTYATLLRTTLTVGTLAAVTFLHACSSTAPRAQMPSPRSTVLNSSPSDSSELHIADTALQGGNVQMAGSIYERELAAHPESLEALLGLADANYLGGDMSRAGPLYARADILTKGARPARLGLARVALHEHRFAEAISIYEPMVKANPADAIAWSGLGSAWDMSGDHVKAQSVYRAGLSAAPSDVALRSNLGLSLVLSGQPREGANLLLEIAGATNAPPQARQNLALAYGVLGNGEAAGRILSMDLPKASVTDNLRYYDTVRAMLATHGAAPAINQVPVISSTAHTAVPVKPSSGS